MPTSEVVSGILLHLLWAEELAVGSCAHHIDDRWLQIDHHTTRDVLACTSLGEERVEGIVVTTNRLVVNRSWASS